MAYLLLASVHALVVLLTVGDVDQGQLVDHPLGVLGGHEGGAAAPRLAGSRHKHIFIDQKEVFNFIEYF